MVYLYVVLKISYIDFIQKAHPKRMGFLYVTVGYKLMNNLPAYRSSDICSKYLNAP